MENNEKLLVMYQFALEKKLCENKSTFSELTNVNLSNLSKAFQGNPKYATSSLLLKVNAALNNTFSPQWLIHNKGEMLTATDTNQLENDDLIQAKKRIEELEYVLELQKHRILQLERECEQLKKASSIAMTHPATTA